MFWANMRKDWSDETDEEGNPIDIDDICSSGNHLRKDCDCDEPRCSECYSLLDPDGECSNCDNGEGIGY
jgi:hypothetical protein